MGKTFFNISIIMSCFYVACSTVPEFRPSVPVEEASSFNNALDICASYQIAGPHNGSGNHALPAPVSTMVPWLNCYEAVFRKFSEAKSSPDFVAYFRSLKEVHDVMHPRNAEAENVDWVALNSVVKLITQHLHAEPYLHYSNDELHIIQEQLPSYAFYLAETNQYSASKGKPVEARLNINDEQIRALILYTDTDGSQPHIPRGPLSKDQKKYCKQFQTLKTQVTTLTELSLYQKALEDQSTKSGIQYDKLTARISSMKKDAIMTQKNLESARITIQAKSPEFRNEFCLQSGVHYEKR